MEEAGLDLNPPGRCVIHAVLAQCCLAPLGRAFRGPGAPVRRDGLVADLATSIASSCTSIAVLVAPLRVGREHEEATLELLATRVTVYVAFVLREVANWLLVWLRRRNSTSTGTNRGSIRFGFSFQCSGRLSPMDTTRAGLPRDLCS